MEFYVWKDKEGNINKTYKFENINFYTKSLKDEVSPEFTICIYSGNKLTSSKTHKKSPSMVSEDLKNFFSDAGSIYTNPLWSKYKKPQP